MLLRIVNVLVTWIGTFVKPTAIFRFCNIFLFNTIVIRKKTNFPPKNGRTLPRPRGTLVYSNFNTVHLFTQCFNLSLIHTLVTLQLKLLITNTQSHQHYLSQYLVVFYTNYLNPFIFSLNNKFHVFTVSLVLVLSQDVTSYFSFLLFLTPISIYSCGWTVNPLISNNLVPLNY